MDTENKSIKIIKKEILNLKYKKEEKEENLDELKIELKEN